MIVKIILPAAVDDIPVATGDIAGTCYISEVAVVVCAAGVHEAFADIDPPISARVRILQ